MSTSLNKKKENVCKRTYGKSLTSLNKKEKENVNRVPGKINGPYRKMSNEPYGKRKESFYMELKLKYD